MFSCVGDNTVANGITTLITAATLFVYRFSGYCYMRVIKSSYFLTKTYVVCTQNNRLNETVLLSTQNVC